MIERKTNGRMREKRKTKEE